MVENSLLKSLESFSLSNIVKHKNAKQGVPKSVIDFHESTPLYKALEEMRALDVLAAPVFSNSADYSTKVYLGLVSVHEILSFAFFQDIFDPKSHDKTNYSAAALNEFRKNTFFESTIGTILNNRKEPQAVLYSASDSIASLIRLFTHGHHRALVVSAEIVIDGIPAESSLSMITQMDLLRYFYDALKGSIALPTEFVEPIFTKPLSDVKFVERNVLAVSDYQPALAGFNVMHINNVHAVPIINNEDAIVGTLSMKDLRGLTPENLSSLAKPCSDFGSCTFVGQVIDTASGECRVEEVVQLMLKERSHHVWITKGKSIFEETGKVISGCVTPTDLLKLFEIQ